MSSFSRVPKLILFIALGTGLLSGCRPNGVTRREAAAKIEMRNIYVAEEMHRVMKNRYGTLEELAKEKLVAEDIGRGITGGYKFEVELRANGFNAYATPQNYDSWFDVKNSFYINEKEILTCADKQGHRADAGDEQVQR